ncbi:hypothetical protein BGX21_010746 [Mortierella sp. AD011]|nr:hypothetical protein BGX20_010560 [Mortierella sp. AD010]KAF9393458.1 hypothetical protein BGX21_010746 [Mortierella sp. AD011]
MKSVERAITKSPLDFPEIRLIVATYLSRSDAIACSIVCKAWSEDFISNVWHSVDFKVHKMFKSLDPKIIAKYGKHIRVVASLDKTSQLTALQDPSICNLKSISVASLSSEFRLYLTDLIRRNSNTITDLVLTSLVNPFQPDVRMDFESVDALVPNTPPNKSSLTSVTLKNLRMTRDSLSTLLFVCPALNDISISRCVFLKCRNYDFHQNFHVTKFCASIGQILYPHPGHDTVSLLVHFPNLKVWANLDRDSLAETTAKSFRKEMMKYCSDVVAVESYASPSTVVENIFSALTQPLEKIQFSYDTISPGVIKSILFHSSTLLSIEANNSTIKNWDYDADEVFDMADNASESGFGWMIQTIPMTCSRLEVIILPSHKMDMDIVERMPWTCMDLRVLKIRVQGLETKKRIQSVVKRWQHGLQAQRQKIHLDVMTGVKTEEKDSINNKVLRHLLQFKKLTTVWLGYKTWRA